MQSGRYHKRGNLRAEGLHVHAKVPRRFFPWSIAGIKPPRDPLDLRRRKALPAIVHDHIRLYLRPFAQRHDKLRVRKKVSRRIASVGGIPVVESDHRLLRQTRMRAHERTEPPPRVKRAFSWLRLAPHHFTGLESTITQFKRTPASSEVQKKDDLPRFDTPCAHGARLYLHTEPIRSLPVVKQHVPRYRLPLTDRTPCIRHVQARTFPRQNAPMRLDRQAEYHFRVLGQSVAGRHLHATILPHGGYYTVRVCFLAHTGHHT